MIPAASAPRFTEKTPLAPRSPYSATKAAADHLALAYHTTHGLDVVVTRGPVRVAAPAELLEDAFVGAEVMVRNRATGAVQRGILVDSSTVELP